MMLISCYGPVSRALLVAAVNPPECTPTGVIVAAAFFGVPSNSIEDVDCQYEYGEYNPATDNCDQTTELERSLQLLVLAEALRMEGL